MAHQYKSAAHRNDPKWLGRLKRATGGAANESDGYDTYEGDGTYAAGPRRIAIIPGEPPTGGIKLDTQMETDTGFGRAHDVKTFADRMRPLKPQYLGRKRGGKVK